MKQEIGSIWAAVEPLTLELRLFSSLKSSERITYKAITRDVECVSLSIQPPLCKQNQSFQCVWQSRGCSPVLFWLNRATHYGRLEVYGANFSLRPRSLRFLFLIRIIFEHKDVTGEAALTSPAVALKGRREFLLHLTLRGCVGLFVCL